MIYCNWSIVIIIIIIQDISRIYECGNDNVLAFIVK